MVARVVDRVKTPLPQSITPLPDQYDSLPKSLSSPIIYGASGLARRKWVDLDGFVIETASLHLSPPPRRMSALLGLACLLFSCAYVPPVPRYGTSPRESDFPITLGVIGNTFIAEDRTHSPARILKSILDDAPVLLIHTGNLVSDGASQEAWWAFDDFAEPLREASIPLLPTRGLFDVGGGQETALHHWAERFGDFGRNTWFAVQYKNLLMVVLDSNLKALGGHRPIQREWLARRLHRADLDSSVSFVFVNMVHSMFSNSGPPPPKDLLLDLLPVIEASKKTRVVFSSGGGTYERIHNGGKWWISTAGGGGPRTPVETMPGKRRFIDAFHGGRDRPFHYIRVTVEATKFTFEAVALGADGESLAVVDRFSEGKADPPGCPSSSESFRMPGIPCRPVFSRFRTGVPEYPSTGMDHPDHPARNRRELPGLCLAGFSRTPDRVFRPPPSTTDPTTFPLREVSSRQPSPVTIRSASSAAP
jgi:hypothetical protein